MKIYGDWRGDQFYSFFYRVLWKRQTAESGTVNFLLRSTAIDAEYYLSRKDSYKKRHSSHSFHHCDGEEKQADRSPNSCCRRRGVPHRNVRFNESYSRVVDFPTSLFTYYRLTSGKGTQTTHIEKDGQYISPIPSHSIPSHPILPSSIPFLGSSGDWKSQRGETGRAHTERTQLILAGILLLSQLFLGAPFIPDWRYIHIYIWELGFDAISDCIYSTGECVSLREKVQIEREEAKKNGQEYRWEISSRNGCYCRPGTVSRLAPILVWMNCTSKGLLIELLLTHAGSPSMTVIKGKVSPGYNNNVQGNGFSPFVAFFLDELLWNYVYAIVSQHNIVGNWFAFGVCLSDGLFLGSWLLCVTNWICMKYRLTFFFEHDWPSKHS